MGKQKTMKRSALRTTGASALVAAGIYFDSKNEGAHLVVSLNKDGNPLADYWPGANHWRTRKGGIRGRGAESLISYLQTGKFPEQQVKVESLTLVAHPDDHAVIRRFAQELASQRLLPHTKSTPGDKDNVG